MTSLKGQTGVGADVTPSSPNSSTASGNAWLKPGEDAGGYDPDKFFTRAHDHHGHGEVLRFKVPPDVYAQIQVMVHEDGFPDYRLPADFVRDAIVHHLHRRKDQLSSARFREGIEATITALSLAETVHKSNEEALRWHGINDEIEATMTTLYNDGAFAQMVYNLMRYEEFMGNAAEPYRGKTLAVIKGWRGKIPAEYLEEPDPSVG